MLLLITHSPVLRSRKIELLAVGLWRRAVAVLPHRPKNVVPAGGKVRNVQEALDLGPGEVVLVNPGDSKFLEYLGTAAASGTPPDGRGVRRAAWVLVCLSQVKLNRDDVRACEQPRVANKAKRRHDLSIAARDEEGVRRGEGGGQRQGPLVLEEDILRLCHASPTVVPPERRAEHPVAYSDVYSDGLVSNLT